MALAQDAPAGMTAVLGTVGAEDITIHPTTGIAFISADDRRKTFQGDSLQGGLYSYALTEAHPVVRLLTPDLPFVFHPHGISLWVGIDADTAVTRLFVINHRGGDGDTTTVEVFDFLPEGHQLIHKRTLRSDMLFSPNDLHAVGPDSFYFTNDHGSRSGFGRAMEDLFKLRKGWLGYYGKGEWKRVGPKTKYANGINGSADGKYIYVAELMSGKLHIYKRSVSSGELELLKKVKLTKGIDNIERDAKGNLWIVAHTNLFKFVQHFANAKNRSPWRVYRVDPSSVDEPVVDVMYNSAGVELSGVSVAAVWKDNVLYGSVFEPVILHSFIIPSPLPK